MQRSRQNGGLDLQHAPRPRAAADQRAIMDLPRIDRDDVAGHGLDRAAAAGRSLCPALDDAEPVCIVAMPAEGPRARGLDGDGAGQQAARATKHDPVTAAPSAGLDDLARRPFAGPAGVTTGELGGENLAEGGMVPQESGRCA